MKVISLLHDTPFALAKIRYIDELQTDFGGAYTLKRVTAACQESESCKTRRSKHERSRVFSPPSYSMSALDKTPDDLVANR